MEIKGEIEVTKVQSPALTLLSLNDTPDSYAGNNGKVLTVNEADGKVEFTTITIPQTGVDETALKKSFLI